MSRRRAGALVAGVVGVFMAAVSTMDVPLDVCRLLEPGTYLYWLFDCDKPAAGGGGGGAG